MGLATASYSTQTYPYVDPLCIDDIVSHGGILASGNGSLKRGQLLEAGSVATAGKWIVAAATASAILAEDADSTAGDASIIVYVGGKFMASGIIWGGMNHAAATEQLRDVGIQLEPVMVGTGAMVKGVNLPTEDVRADDTAIAKDPNPTEIITDQGPVPAIAPPSEPPDPAALLEPHPSPLRVQPGQTEPPIPPAPKERLRSHSHPVQPPTKTEQKK